MLAKGALKPISISIIPVLITLIVGYFYWHPSYYLSIFFTTLSLLILIFFRDPDRKIGQGIVSPADGKVILVDKKFNRIDVFMNLTHVHVNRAPFGGIVRETQMIKGAFKPAFSAEAENNFKHKIVLDTELGKLTIFQITGFFARRIVPYIKDGDRIDKGDRIGLIRFGSRVRMDLPEDVKITINEDDIVKAGETNIGICKKNSKDKVKCDLNGNSNSNGNDNDNDNGNGNDNDNDNDNDNGNDNMNRVGNENED